MSEPFALMIQNTMTPNPADIADPAAATALAQQAGRAMQAGHAAEARLLLARATELDHSNAALWLHLAATCRATADLPAALTALEQALRVEPRYFPALLMKATLIEREGKSREAAQAFGIALTLAPPDARLDATTLAVVQRGRELYRRYQLELRAHLDAKLLDTAVASSAEAQRLAQFIDTTLGLKPRVQQNPSSYFYPGLPPIEFWPRDAFPWLAELEAATLAIQVELAAVLASQQGFTPYVEYGDGIPLDQWAALNHSLDWSAFQLYHYGKRYPDNCARCPQTMQALARLPQPAVEGRMPAAMFSVLKPRTRIPPHTGVANVRLVVHLPLIVPPGCGYRVGNVTRQWRVGEAFVFDDTIEHEAWNDSDQTRVVLIADIWHPHLSRAERELIGKAMIEMDAFNGVSTPLPL